MFTNKKKKLIFLIAIVLLTIITGIGISYAFFNYAKKGRLINTAITGNLSFSYRENACNSNFNGISLTNQMPLSDTDGKNQNDCGENFNFNIKANTTPAPINYTVTAKINNDSDIDTKNIKIYLATVNDDLETQTESTYLNGEVAVLDDFYALDENDQFEKIIYTERIAKGNKDFNKQFRLKIWLDENTILYDNTDPNNIIDNREKSFQIKINVYAESEIETVMGKATDWILRYNYDTKSSTIESTINNYINEFQTPTKILNVLCDSSLNYKNLIHYFKGDLRKELDWYWGKIENSVELTDSDISEFMPITETIIDSNTTNDANILDYAIVKEFTKMEITPNITIPNVIVYPDGTKYNVKNIGNSLFSYIDFNNNTNLDYQKITNVTIPEGIEIIGTVKEINQMGDLVLGPFVSCPNLTSITLPSSLKEIGNLAFANTAITNITIPDGVTKIGVDSFGDTKITKIILPSSIQYIGQSAFSHNNLSKLLFAGNSELTTIDKSAFNFNNLTYLYIPASVTTINRSAFEFNNISTLIFEDTNERPAQITKLNAYIFGSNDLKTITIPASVTNITTVAFSDNSNLTNIIVKRTDATGLTLEEGWNQNATVIYQP